MSNNDDPSKRKDGEVPVDISQLRPGVHVRLPVSWMEHQFMFSSFVIKDEEQIKQIQALNLPQILCDPDRCKVPPLEKDDNPPAPSPIDEAEKQRLEQLRAENLAKKQARAKAVKEIQEKLDTSQRHYLDATKSVSSAFKSFGADPVESVRQIAAVSTESAKVVLQDMNSAITLIAEKGQSDGASAHALSVMTLSLLLGKQALLPENALTTLAMGALLHDLGHAKINPSILKNMERNKHEQALYMEHCRYGLDIAKSCGKLPRPVLEAIAHHHENFDGSGFPSKQAGESIHIAARIVGIANRFDNLSNPVDYRAAMSPSEALSKMWVKEKKNYDPKLLQLFIKAMGVYPPGSLVKLNDERTGAVVRSAPPDQPLCPQVMVYDPDVPRKYAEIIDTSVDETVKIEHALRLRDRSDDELDYLLPRRKLNWFHASKK